MKATDGAIVGTLARFAAGSVEALAACERFMVRGGASSCEAGRSALASLVAEQLLAPLWTGSAALVLFEEQGLLVMAMVVTAQTGLSDEVAASAAVYPKYARASVQCAEYTLM